MGIAIQEVQFEGRAPVVLQIADAITRACGLRVIVAESSPEVKSELYELHANLAFECATQNTIEIFSYLPGSARELFGKLTAGTSPLLENQLQGMLSGLNEPPGCQSVHLRGFVGQEPTLFIMTTIALEKLGGQIKHPLSEELRRTYSGLLTPDLLQHRQRKTRRQVFRAMALFILLLPINIPIFILDTIIMMPIRAWRAHRLVRQELDKTDTPNVIGTKT